MGHPTDTNAKMAQQQRKGVSYTVLADMILAGQLVRVNRIKLSYLIGDGVSELGRLKPGCCRCELLL
jgi:hypothetical protein